ncbi:MAG: hypothetical protein COV29_02265 [Candidatus Yanofskybacteria bacterium CG10_big_fil_rev_8_21_14_0_10_36_16]|uniref:Thiolase C-terminal domain-containing protein n=1 Tax=Candidatus Yanofskybacteria bacterium CG10_big_fil_rev_8_21_14_0_10_36_16 TaxID=1975096 RepID=A0A2J0Q7L6_9BACT|nr:MAG: hypothetical protein COV29_02265 [Candidatus Yanofskybacteria bacterium CG10_big_fil_rev_8_21_14_0_10_36_16]
MRETKNSAIIGVGLSKIGKFPETPVTSLMVDAFCNAILNAKSDIREIDALIVCSTLVESNFMTAHRLAYFLGISGQLSSCYTVDVGGAGPVSGLILANDLLVSGRAKNVAVVAGDKVGSLSGRELVLKANSKINHPLYPKDDPSLPVIPILYNSIAQWHMDSYGTTREQLAMVAVLMSIQASRHPNALNRKVLTLDEALSSRKVASVTNVLECARPADGAGAVIVSSEFSALNNPVYVRGCGEGVGCPYPQREIFEDMFSVGRATKIALSDARLRVEDIDWFGIYDCFPICFLKFLEDAGLVPVGLGGQWIEEFYDNYTEMSAPDDFPVNTHGGLLSFGAPWEAPAMFSIIEAVEQIRGVAKGRQVTNPHSALVYGNGGIFTSSSVVILSN